MTATRTGDTILVIELAEPTRQWGLAALSRPRTDVECYHIDHCGLLVDTNRRDIMSWGSAVIAGRQPGVQTNYSQFPRCSAIVANNSLRREYPGRCAQG